LAPPPVVHPAFQVVRLELVQSEIIGAGTSAVVLRGADVEIPEGAVLVAPAGSSTSLNGV
jgi:hypothetical protein